MEKKQKRSNKKNGKMIPCKICGVKKYKSQSQIKPNGLNYCGRKCQAKGSSLYGKAGYKKGHPSYWTKESSVKYSKTRMGHEVSQETRNKISRGNLGNKKPWISGERHYKWKKDRNTLKKYKGSEEKRGNIYKNWRKDVKERDKYKCRLEDENCSGKLEVHHILGFTEFPESKYDINNGITLCHAHHPRVRAEEKRLVPVFQKLVSVSK